MLFGKILAHISRDQRGFTLPELLMTTAIIGTLAAASTVSYSSVRTKARDTKRMVDMRQIQVAMDLYLDSAGGFPGDGRPGPAGIPLGEESYTAFSQNGFSPTVAGETFMALVPANPTPNGTRYIYRSLNADGTDCNEKICASFAILFATEGPFEGMPAGVHAMGPNGIVEAKGFLPQDMQPAPAGRSTATIDRFDSFVTEAGSTVRAVVNDPAVQRANETVVAPTVAVATAANTTFATLQFWQYLLLFMTQPAALFGMRRRKQWGVVYNSLSRMPEDLVIVRLRNTKTNKVVQSAVTDAEGRFSFLVPYGEYKIEAAKVGITFPSVFASKKSVDGPYHDLYHGGVLTVDAGGSVLTPHVPVDPQGVDVPDEKIIKQSKTKKWHQQVALASPVLGGIIFLMRPTVFVGLLFAAEIVLYFLFKRIANPSEPQNWGTVYDQVTRKPVMQAVVRIFSAKYNKLLETQVTDQHGRYHFRVMGDRFYLTVTHKYYRKTETEPFDLTTSMMPVVIASDLPLAPLNMPVPAKPVQQAKVPALPQSLAAKPAPKPTPALPDALAAPKAPEPPKPPAPPAKPVPPPPRAVPPPRPAPLPTPLPKPVPPPPQPPPPPPKDTTKPEPPEPKEPPPPKAWFRDS